MNHNESNKAYVMIAIGAALIGVGVLLYRSGHREVGSLIVFWASIIFVLPRIQNLLL